MFTVVFPGALGVICMAVGVWFVGRQHRRRAGTRAGWGTMAIGVGLLFRAAGFLTGNRQPLGFALTACFAAFSVTGYILVLRNRDRDLFRNGRGGRKRRKLPPLHP